MYGRRTAQPLVTSSLPVHRYPVSNRAGGFPRREYRSITKKRRIASSPRSVYMAGMVSDGSLGFDFSSVLSTIGSAALKVGSSLYGAGGTLITGLLQPQNVSSIVQGIVAKQVAKVQTKIAAPSAPSAVVLTSGGGYAPTGGGGGGSFYPSPMNISVGGGSVPAYAQVTSSEWIPGVSNTVVLLIGGGIAAAIILRR